MSLLDSVLARSDIWRGDRLATACRPGVPTGYASLDAELPGGGWPAGALTELLLDGEGIGEMQLLIPALARLSRSGRLIALIAPPYIPYAPALAAGLDLAQLMVVACAAFREALWTAGQILRSGACGAVLAWLSPVKYTELRRLQLAAEEGHTVAALFRPGRAAAQASPAPLRLVLAPAGGQLAIDIIKRHGPRLRAPLRIAVTRPVSDSNVLDSLPLPAPAAGNIPARSAIIR
ncbi:MAG TPA: translesion DNA synthesis-associated protein ImuA [Burkholderiales bacterium]|nr:translesion DNA synthesis-associated protein ImuA [Burkholderiales bacterium]